LDSTLSLVLSNGFMGVWGEKTEGGKKRVATENLFKSRGEPTRSGIKEESKWAFRERFTAPESGFHLITTKKGGGKKKKKKEKYQKVTRKRRGGVAEG